MRFRAASTAVLLIIGGSAAADPLPLPAPVVAPVTTSAAGTLTNTPGIPSSPGSPSARSPGSDGSTGLFPAASLAPNEQSAPINLATAFQLARVRPLDVALAGQQVELAEKQLQRARLLWVPNIIVGADYFRHEGGQQNFTGDIVRSSRGSVAAGVGPNIVFSTSDAVMAPLAARQDLFARTAFRTAADNDITLEIAQVYFTLQQARGELAGAEYVLKAAEDVAAKTTELARGLAPSLEANRARVELARRKQAVTTARMRWRTASAELTRILRLDPNMIVEPMESPELRLTLITDEEPTESLIPIALTSRPELAGHQAVVRATLARLKQEHLRPFLPSLALRSTSTNPSGSIAYGGFGGGAGSTVNNFGSRFDIDVQLLWEFSALGFGNRVRVAERRVENQMATLQLFRLQDQIASEVVVARAETRAAAERVRDAEPALREAMELVSKAREGMSQTRRTGEILTLVVRPQEVIAAVQSLSQAIADYYAAIGDYNRSQFRLYRALGHPAAHLMNAVPQISEAIPGQPAKEGTKSPQK